MSLFVTHLHHAAASKPTHALAGVRQLRYLFAGKPAPLLRAFQRQEARAPHDRQGFVQRPRHAQASAVASSSATSARTHSSGMIGW